MEAMNKSEANTPRILAVLAWPIPGWIRGSRCDVPDCENESSPDYCLKTEAVVGPVLDIPLHLFFCEDHKDFDSLFRRYTELFARR